MTILWTAPAATFTLGETDYAPGLTAFETKVDSPVETGLMRSQADVTVARWAGFAGDLLPNRGAFRLGVEAVFATPYGVAWRGRIYRLLSATREPDTVSFRVVDALWFYDNPRPAGSYIYDKPEGTTMSPTQFRVVTGGQRLNVRHTPNPSAPVIGFAVNGQIVEVVELRDGWARLAAGGWVLETWLVSQSQNHPFSGGYGISGGYFKTGVTVREAIAHILKWAGWNGTLSGGADLDIPTYNPINKGEGEGLVTHAGRLAWEYGHYLYQTPDGQIHLRRFTGEGETLHTFSCQNAHLLPDFDFSITDTEVSVEATGWRLEADGGVGDDDEGEQSYEVQEEIYDERTNRLLGKITESLEWRVEGGGQAVREQKTEEEWVLEGVMSPQELLPGTLSMEKVNKITLVTDIYVDGLLVESREEVKGHGVFLQNQANARDWITSWNSNRQAPQYRTLLTSMLDISRRTTTYSRRSTLARDYGLRVTGERGILAETITEEWVSILDAGRIILEPDNNGVMGLVAPKLVKRSHAVTLHGQNRTGDWEKMTINTIYDYNGAVLRAGESDPTFFLRQGRRTVKRFPPEQEPVRIPSLSRVANIQLPGEPEPKRVPLSLQPFTFAVTAPTTATSPNPRGQTRYLRADYLAGEGYAQYYANLMAAVISGQLDRVRVQVPLPYHTSLHPWDSFRISGEPYAGDYWCVGISLSWTTARFCAELTLIRRSNVPWVSGGTGSPPVRREGVG